MGGESQCVWGDSGEGSATMKEITIIGGGLAGLSLGVYLKKLDIPVKLYEAGKYPKHKVCGEFICGVSEEVLHEMGMDNIITDSTHHHEMLWAIGDEEVSRRETPHVAWGLSRYKLDLDLAEMLTMLGGELMLGKRVKLDEFKTEGLIRGVGKSKAMGSQEWIGLKVHACDVNELAGLEMHVGEAGYMGLCEVEGARVNCCGLFKVNKELKGKGSEMILNYLRANGLNDLRDRIKSWEIDEESFSATAGFSLGQQAVGNDFCIGDAAYLIPPFTGNGMSMAIESAYIAGNQIKRYTEGEMSWGKCRAQYQQEISTHFKKRMRLAMALHPLLFKKASITLLKNTVKMRVLPFDYLFRQLRTP